jgi:hypothetical protein
MILSAGFSNDRPQRRSRRTERAQDRETKPAGKK